MYQKEPVVDVKRGILGALAISGATSRMIEVVTTERSPELRVSAVRHLGMMGGKAGADTLVSAYGKESDVQVRRAVIETLSFDNGNGDVLVSLARKETNPELRRELVRRLSRRGGAEAPPYGEARRFTASPSPRSLTPVKRTMNSCPGASPA
jgi:hypothetical protein